MNDLYGKIVQALHVQLDTDLVVIVDGQFLQRSGKMVYLRVSSISGGGYSVNLFVVERKNGAAIKEELPFSVLSTKMMSQEYHGIKVAHTMDIDSCNINVFSSLGLVVMESPLYATARAIVEGEDAGEHYASAIVGNANLSESTVNKLSEVFRAEAFRSYLNLVYAPGNNRFVNRLMKYHQFYRIQKSFVPVFISFTAVYDPFRARNSKLEKTKMYLTAVEKGRRLEYEGTLSCYLLTHEEICKAFGMQHFMRFTSNFWYSVFVGLFKSSLEGFPRQASQSSLENDRVYVLTRGDLELESLKTRYTPIEYFETIKLCQQELNSATESHNEPARREATEKLEVLRRYVQYDTLQLACARNLVRLTTFGPYQLDKKRVTATDLYGIISEARLEVVV